MLHESPRVVTITRSSCGKAPDRDNLYGSMKPILDAMIDAGIILDDSPEHITLEVKWQKANKRKDQKVAVEVI